MAGPAIHLPIETTGLALDGWQLAKTPTAAQVALVVTDLTVDITNISVVTAGLAPEYFDVSMFESIAIQVWGVAADTNTFTLELYGWGNNGPGHHIQQMAGCIFGAFTSAASAGFHQSARTHPSIRNAFAAATAYRGADTYLLTALKDFTVKKELVAPAVQIQTNLEADFPAEFIVDFTTGNYKYFSVMATATTGTSVGAIFKPLKMKQRL